MKGWGVGGVALKRGKCVSVARACACMVGERATGLVNLGSCNRWGRDWWALARCNPLENLLLTVMFPKIWGGSIHGKHHRRQPK